MDYTLLPPELIRPKKYEDGKLWNLRGDDMDTTEIQNTAWESGIREPLKVTLPDAMGVHAIIDGHRRYVANNILLERAQVELVRARKKGQARAGDDIRFYAERVEWFSRLPVFIMNVESDDADNIFDMMLLSFVRKDLDPISTAKAFQRLREVHGWSVQRLAARIGWDVSKVEQILGTLGASQSVQSALRSGRIALSTYDRYMKGSSTARQDRIMDRLEEADRPATAANVLSVIREERGAAESPVLLPQFLDLAVMPALNTSLERLRYAYDKRDMWSPSTRIAAQNVLAQMEELLVVLVDIREQEAMQ